MHKFAEEIAECLKAKVKAVGIDNIEGQNLEEVKTWTEIVKNLVCYDKDFKIVEAMEEEKDSEKSMEMYRKYSEDEYPEVRYYDHYRYKNGRFAPKGNGTYSRYYSYDPNSDYHMNNNDYRMWSGMDESERMRDIDRYNGGRMYYTGHIMPRNYSAVDESRVNLNGSGGNIPSDRRDYREGRSGMSRRTYMESKEKGADKQKKLQDLDAFFDDATVDFKEMIVGMSPEEKQKWSQRFTSMASAMQV